MAELRALARRRPFWSLAAGLLALSVLGVVGLQARARKAQYVTAAVTRGDIQRSVSTTGALNPVITVQVGSYVSGTVKTLSCDFNTEVVVGQLCATIDPVPFQLIVEEDKAQVGTAEAQLKKDQASLTYAKTAYERDAKLVEEGTVSQDAVDSEKSAYDQAVAQIGLDQASVVDKQAALKAAQVNLAYTNIVSPVVGTVITRSIDVGQTVAASLQSPTLFIIAKDLTQMQVDTNVSEADVGDIRVGQDTFFTVQAFAGKTFRGQVRQIRHGPITVQNVVTYDVVIGVPNPDRSLFPGMTADTHIVTDSRTNVLRVPLPAVRFNPEGWSAAKKQAGKGDGKGRGEGRKRDEEGDGERASHGEGKGGRHGGASRSQVWVLENGALKPVAVSTGLDDGALIEVSGEGLREGDKVVVNQIVPGSTPPRPGQAASGQGQGFRPPGAGTGPGPGPGPRP